MSLNFASLLYHKACSDLKHLRGAIYRTPWNSLIKQDMIFLHISNILGVSAEIKWNAEWCVHYPCAIAHLHAHMLKPVITFKLFKW